MESAEDGREPLPPWLRLLLVGLVVYRLAYHLTYLGEVPFALGTYADGAIHEATARDLLEHFPLGRVPFFLEGTDAYVLAVGMLPRAWISFGLLFQLGLAALGLVAFHRASTLAFGRVQGSLSTVVMLASAEVLFYENKYLPAWMGVLAASLLLLALVRAGRDEERLGPWLGAGAALGLLILVRTDAWWLLAPLLVVAGRGEAAAAPRLRPVGGVALGLVLALGPMALRNQLVTGYPDTAPVHGSGPAFFAGNNPESRGTWNAAGGVLGSFAVVDAAELTEETEDTSTDARTRGRKASRELWRRGGRWIAGHPGAFAVLELRKAWLTVGNDQLGLIYDRRGEEELMPWAHRVAFPLGALLAFAVLGLADPRLVARLRDPELRPARIGALALALLVVISSLVFYASSPGRLLVYVPLAWLGGPGLVALAGLVRRLRRRDEDGEHPVGPRARGVLVAMLLAAQAAWPRVKDPGHAHPVFCYNLAVVQDETGEPLAALESLDRALGLRPNDATFRLRRAHLRRRLGQFDACESDLDRAAADPGRLTPAQVDYIELERALLQIDRETAAGEAAASGAGYGQ